MPSFLKQIAELRASITAVSADLEEVRQSHFKLQTRAQDAEAALSARISELKAVSARIAHVEGEYSRVLALGKGFERDYRTTFEQSCVNLQRAEKAERALAEVSRRLQKYARHLPECGIHIRTETIGISRLVAKDTFKQLCTCGFNELALSAPNRPEEQGAGSRSHRPDQETS